MHQIRPETTVIPDLVDAEKEVALQAAAHDLRMPLDGMAQLIAELNSESLSEDGHERLALLDAAIAYLRSVATDILDHGRIGAGHDLGPAESFDPAALLASIAGVAAARARESGVEFATAIGALPARLPGRPRMLRRAIENLLDNAFKHGGMVLLAAGCDRQTLRIGVGDNGPGITTEDLPQLFKPYASLAASGRAAGTGLGLALVKAIVERLGGKIGVETQPGEGARFEIALPIGAAGIDSPSAKPTLPRGTKGRLDVLVVDDNLFSRRFAKTMLEALGHVVRETDNAHQALAEIAAIVPDVILMDLEMPGGDGLAALRAIRNLPGEAAHRPVIAVSARGEFARTGALAAGFDGYISKPMDPRIVTESLAAVLESFASAQEV